MKWKLLAVFAVFASLLAVRLAGVLSEDASDVKAVNGSLDLRGWDTDSGKMVSLQGKWSFYPGLLIQPGEPFPEKDRVDIQVPGGWDRQMGSPFGFGTYRLLLLLPDPKPGEERKYAIRTSIIRNSHALFVNGRRIGGSGEPGITETTAKPLVLPYVAAFSVSGNRAEVVIQAANFQYARMGGIFQEIYFGTKETVERRSIILIGQNSIIMGLFLICGLFFLQLYIFRPRSRELLYFSLFFWASLLFWLTHNEKLLFRMIPGMTYDIQLRLQALPSAVLFASMVGFVKWMYPNPSHKWPMRIAFAGVFVFTSTCLFTPLTFFTGGEVYLYAFDLILLLYCCYVLIKEAARGTPYSVYTFIAACCIMYEGIFQGLYYVGFDSLYDFPPIEKAVFAVAMSMVIAKRFMNGMNEVETLSKKLLVADRLKNDFLATTSGELSLPLHGMINIAQVMMNDESLGERQRERLTLLMATGRRLSHLLNDILDLSKLNEGNLTLQLRPVDIRTLIGGVTDVMRYLKDDGSVLFDNRVEAGMPQVMADEHRLMQILFHLFHYAVKWGAQGAVMVTADLGDEGSVELSIRSAGRYPDSRSRTRMEADRNQKADADFSLEISRKLLNLHGSELSVKEVGQELRIGFALAAGEEAEALTAASGEWQRPDSREGEPREKGLRRHYVPGSPRVLLVDDDPVSLRVMFDILVQERLDVTALTDGNEALQLIISEGGWDLIVMEAMLPQLSGFDLCRKIRERHSFYDLPVLFVTVRDQPAYLLVGFDAGANDYVTKPFKTSEFLARTRILLRMKQSIRERLDIEMALIQAQIKPHFLYNTLNTIASLSEIDPDRTRDLLADFGTYLQSSFDLRNLDRTVPFEKEWALVQSYLNIEKARFGDRIQVTSDLPEHFSFALPPLTLQPVVENALRHGILKRIEGGRIHIAVTERPGYMRISVRDDGEGFPLTKKAAVLDGTYHLGIGLVNVNRRLKNAYGSGLSIETEEGKGTEVCFDIPIEAGKEEIA